jgi:hypothetical protein
VKHRSGLLRRILLNATLLAMPVLIGSAQTAKTTYRFVINLRTLNDNGHQEIYTTYYPANDQEKKAKLQECLALAAKVVGRPDSNYRVIISSSCTVDD